MAKQDTTKAQETTTEQPKEQTTKQVDPNQSVELSEELKNGLLGYYDLSKNPKEFNDNNLAIAHAQIYSLLVQDTRVYTIAQVQAMVNYIAQTIQKENNLMNKFNTQSGHLTILDEDNTSGEKAEEKAETTTQS